MGGITFGIDSDGNYGYIKAGADTVTPFNGLRSIKKIQGAWSGYVSTVQLTNAVIGEIYYLVENTENTFSGAEIIDHASIPNFTVYILKATDTTITGSVKNTVWLFTKFS